MSNGRPVLFYTIIVIFAATALVTLLGLVKLITIEPQYLDLLFKALLLEVIVAVIGLFKATAWFGGKRLVDAAESIRGGWWQLVRVADNNAAGFITIDFSNEQQQLELEGASYGATGGEYASWRSVAAGFNVATRDLYYFWRGEHAAERGIFNGVGAIEFEAAEGKALPTRGAAWFTSGNLDALQVTSRRDAHMRRATPDEVRVMKSDDEPAKRILAAQVYAKWRPEPVPMDRGTVVRV